MYTVSQIKQWEIMQIKRKLVLKLALTYISMRKMFIPPKTPFLHNPCMDKIFKVFFKIKNLVQNIYRYFNKSQSRNERIWQVFRFYNACFLSALPTHWLVFKFLLGFIFFYFLIFILNFNMKWAFSNFQL